MATGTVEGSGTSTRRRYELPHLTDDQVHITALVLIVGLLVIGLSLGTAKFWSVPNLFVILVAMAVPGIASLGQTVAIIAGGFDLSVGGVIPLSGVVFAIVANHVNGLLLFPALAAAVGAGLLVGATNGLLIVKLNVNPLIATLDTLSITGGLAYIFSSGNTIVLNHSGSSVLASRVVGHLSWDIVVFAGLALIAGFIMRYTLWGRRVYAIGGNREAVRRAGVKTARSIVVIYAVCGLLSAIAGIIATSQLQAASASSYTTAELSTITAAVLGGAAISGGTGTILGMVLGSLLIEVVSNGLILLQINSFYQQVFTGVILVIAVGSGRLRETLVRSSRASS